eukprot:10274872-Lingulodinium_polyedra.AAC.1
MPGQRGADKHAAKCAKLPWALPATVVRDLGKLAEEVRAADAQSAARLLPWRRLLARASP